MLIMTKSQLDHYKIDCRKYFANASQIPDKSLKSFFNNLV